MTTVDRSRIEALVRSALGEIGKSKGDASGSPRPVDSGGGVLLTADRGKNLGEPFDPAAMRAFLASTPARIAVGRAGTRYKTNTLLRFRADGRPRKLRGVGGAGGAWGHGGHGADPVSVAEHITVMR